MTYIFQLCFEAQLFYPISEAPYLVPAQIQRVAQKKPRPHRADDRSSETTLEVCLAILSYFF